MNLTFESDARAAEVKFIIPGGTGATPIWDGFELTPAARAGESGWDHNFQGCVNRRSGTIHTGQSSWIAPVAFKFQRRLLQFPGLRIRSNMDPRGWILQTSTDRLGL